MEHVWKKIEELRAGFDLLKEDRTPIDVFTFAEKIAPRFGVNSQVITVRLDRDGIWPAA